MVWGWYFQHLCDSGYQNWKKNKFLLLLIEINKYCQRTNLNLFRGYLIYVYLLLWYTVFSNVIMISNERKKPKTVILYISYTTLENKNLCLCRTSLWTDVSKLCLVTCESSIASEIRSSAHPTQTALLTSAKLPVWIPRILQEIWGWN